MKRHLIWVIAGTAAIGLAVPAFAAVQPNATPDDNGVPGEVRGNCDEAEHAADPECLTVVVTAPTAPSTAAPTTAQVTAPSNTSPATVPSNTVPSTVNSVPDNTTLGTAPSNTVPGNSTPGSTVPGNTVPDNTTVSTAPSNTVNSVPGDISGPCDEAEHANDPRCTGAAPIGDDSSGRGGDDSGHHDDNSGRGGGDDNSDDDNSGHGGGGGDSGDDDNSGHGGDDD